MAQIFQSFEINKSLHLLESVWEGMVLKSCLSYPFMCHIDLPSEVDAIASSMCSHLLGEVPFLFNINVSVQEHNIIRS